MNLTIRGSFDEVSVQTYPHAPGSDEANADGCTCPVIDNARGKGCGFMDQSNRPCFIVDLACPRHGDAECFPDDATFARDVSEPAYGAASRLGEKIA